MNKTFCDRCKKDISDFKIYEMVSLKIEDMKEYATEEKGISYNKTLCPKCANDFMKIVNFECDKYDLRTYVEEATKL